MSRQRTSLKRQGSQFPSQSIPSTGTLQLVIPFSTGRSACISALQIEMLRYVETLQQPSMKEGEPVQSELAFDPFALMDEQPESRSWFANHWQNVLCRSGATTAVAAT